MSGEINEVEARVLGSLIEKEMTTPDYYPLTLNSLVAACNQKSCRDPVMSLDGKAVSEALENLRCQHRLVWEVTSTGTRVPKYKHNADAALGLTPRQKAVLCSLMVRGPQSAAQVRADAARLCDAGDNADIDAVLRELQDRQAGALVVFLPQQAGMRQRLYAHLLSGPPRITEPAAKPEPAPAPALPEKLAALEEKVDAMRSDMDTLRQQLEDLRRQLE